MTPDEARERLLAYPAFTLLRVGWEVEPGRVQGQIVYRLGAGLGPTSRDRTPTDVLQEVVSRCSMPYTDQHWGIEVLASPVLAEIEQP